MRISGMRAAVAGVLVLSGAAGLVYQVAWVRLLTALLGTSAPAVSVVVAVFLGGLAAGAVAGGRLADRGPRHALVALAGVELGIAALALAVPALVLEGSEALVRLLAASPGRWATHALRAGFAAVVLLPPTLLMGATLPLAVRALARDAEGAGGTVGRCYAANTLGAALGAAAAGLVLVERFGVRGAVGWAALANGANALALLACARRASRAGKAAAPRRDGTESLPRAPDVQAGVLARGLALGATGIAGFVGLALEVLWTRALVFRIGNSTYAFTAVLLGVLAGVAAGSGLGARLADGSRRPLRTLGGTLATAGLAALAAIALLSAIGERPGPGPVLSLAPGALDPWHARLGLRVGLAVTVVAPAALALGAAYPLVNRLVLRDLRRVGTAAGGVLALNTVGSIGGALAATYVLAPALGTVDATRCVAVLALGAGGALLVSGLPPGRARAAGGAVAAAALLAAWALPAPRFRGDHEVPGSRVLFESEDPEAHVRLYEKPGGTRHLGVNGWSIGSDAPSFDRKQTLVGLLPFALRDAVRQVLVVGLGSGRTLAAIASQPEVDRIEVAELVPSVVEAAPHFSPEVASSLEDPRVELHVEDGIHHLEVHRARYDVISSDGKLNPESSGNSHLYSTEYYRRARARLAPDGLFVQWVPIYLPDGAFRMVLRTFTSVFPGDRTALFFFAPETLLLVGSPSAVEPVPEKVERRLARPALSAGLARLGFADPERLLSARIAGGDALARRAGPGPRNGWLHPRLEFLVPAGLARTPAHRFEGRNLELLLALARARSGPEPTGAVAEGALAVLEGLRDARRANAYAAGARAFARARERAPDDPRVRWALRAVREERRRLEERVEETPGDARARLALGRFHYLAGRPRRARAHVERALELAPELGRAWSDLGDVRMALDDPDGAARAYREALERGPRAAALLSNLATAHFVAGRTSAAEARYREAVGLAPEDAALRNRLGIVLASEGRLGEALRRFREALERDPEHLGARNNLAGVLLQLGRPAEAVRHYERARDQSSGNVSVLLNLARAYASAGRWRAADRTLRQLPERAQGRAAARRLHRQLRELRMHAGRPDAID